MDTWHPSDVTESNYTIVRNTSVSKLAHKALFMTK
jgi:hypothetical protein